MDFRPPLSQVVCCPAEEVAVVEEEDPEEDSHQWDMEVEEAAVAAEVEDVVHTMIMIMIPSSEDVSDQTSG